MRGPVTVRYPEDKIKEAILHPDLDVRDTAIRYFYSSTRPDHTLMLLAIQALERYGRTKAFSFTHYLNLLPQTEQTIGWVIAEFLDALRICEGKKKGVGSPVGVAKALHLLAPGFFPLWDEKIAKAYRLSTDRSGFWRFQPGPGQG